MYKMPQIIDKKNTAIQDQINIKLDETDTH